jgi:hypothetical protein
MKAVVVLPILLIGSLVTGCSSSSGGSATTDRYRQTWKTSYGATTCTQWTKSMSDNERFVAAHDMIIALKAKDQSDTFASAFAGNVTKGCAGVPVGIKLADVAAGIATLDTTDFN